MSGKTVKLCFFINWPGLLTSLKIAGSVLSQFFKSSLYVMSFFHNLISWFVSWHHQPTPPTWVSGIHRGNDFAAAQGKDPSVTHRVQEPKILLLWLQYYLSKVNIYLVFCNLSLTVGIFWSSQVIWKQTKNCTSQAKHIIIGIVFFVQFWYKTSQSVLILIFMIGDYTSNKKNPPSTKEKENVKITMFQLNI